MGIQSLKKFIRDKYPNTIESCHITEFSQKKIAIDISSYIYKYKSVAGDEWFSFFPNLVRSLRKYDIHGTFIFDGKPPLEKALESDKRKKSKENIEVTVINATNDLEEYKKTKKTTDFLLKIMDKIKNGNTTKVKKLLHSKIEKNYIDVSQIHDWIEKKRKQIVNITPEDIADIKHLFKLFGIPFIQAPGEAEALGSYMNKNKDVEAILTEDTDVLTYGASIFISSFNIGSGYCEIIHLDKLLKEMEYTFEEFRDFCIMCGTDFNSNINGYGCVKVKKFIDEFRSIENFIENEKEKKTPLDYSVFNHVRTREIFQTFGNLNNPETYKSKYWEFNVDFDELSEFLRKKQCYKGMDEIESLWKEAEITFE